MSDLPALPQRLVWRSWKFRTQTSTPSLRKSLRDTGRAARGLPVHLLKRLDQRTAALERRRRRTVSNERRKDIREKIALGGLIVRAGLREADRAYLLGVLLNAATLVVGSREYVRLKTAGALAFRDAPADIKDTRSPRTPTSENGDKASGE